MQSDDDPTHTMGFGVGEVRYTPEKLQQNRRNIVTVTVLAIALVLLAPTYTDWPMKNALGIAAVILVMQIGTWWMFGSKKAGHITTGSSWSDVRKRVGL